MNLRYSRFSSFPSLLDWWLGLEFYNGASQIQFQIIYIYFFFLESTFSVFIDSVLLIYLFWEYIYLYMDLVNVDALLHFPFLWDNHKTFTYSNSISLIYLFSFFHPSFLSVYSYCFTTYNQIRFYFFLSNISVVIILLPKYDILILFRFLD